ncbi:MAG TPA: LysM peptidoglycan-binding domain-containing protein [Verrucomicrobiae bacterium]|nr:LysM peptidoglycan-binding domain-containing protein [Verrucomicrobiae bacterium]
MRKISIWLFAVVFAIALNAGVARAQEDATQQQIDKLSGQIQDLIDGQAAQGKRIDALEKKIADLSDKLNQPGGNDFASADDVKKLAQQVQEIDKKRQDDNQKILDALDKLSKTGIASSHHAPEASPPPPASGPQNGYYYTIQDKDTISGIARKYNSEGVKVTTDQILAANPGLNPRSLIVGKKIFIPDANAK